MYVCVYNSVATIKSGHENKKAPQVDIHVCVCVCVSAADVCLRHTLYMYVCMYMYAGMYARQ